MVWENEKAIKELKGYILQNELPSLESVEVATRALSGGNFFWLECDGCKFVSIYGETNGERLKRIETESDPCNSCCRNYLDNFRGNSF